MLSFKQFIAEETLKMYHRTDPVTAARLQSGEKIKPGGLSFFIDPNMAANYEGAKSNDNIRPGAPTITGKTPLSNAIPDLEWHPDAYGKIFKRIEDQLNSNPNYRPPSLQTVAHDPSTGKLRYQMILPGAVAVTDASGTKKIEPGWRPIFRTDEFGKIVPAIQPHPQNQKIKVNFTPEQIARKGNIERFPASTTYWGGAASNERLSGFPEQQQLHALTDRAGRVQMTRDFMNDPTKREFKGFRTISPANTQIDRPETSTYTTQTTARNVIDTSLSTKIGEIAKSGIGKALKGLDVLSKVTNPAEELLDAGVGAATRLGTGIGAAVVAPLSINQQTSPKASPYQEIENEDETGNTVVTDTWGGAPRYKVGSEFTRRGGRFSPNKEVKKQLDIMAMTPNPAEQMSGKKQDTFKFR